MTDGECDGVIKADSDNKAMTREVQGNESVLQVVQSQVSAQPSVNYIYIQSGQIPALGQTLGATGLGHMQG